MLTNQMVENIDSNRIKELEKFTEAKALPPDKIDFDPTKPDSVAFKRRVQRQRGKWRIFPKGFNSKG